MEIGDVWRVVEQARAGLPPTAPAEEVAAAMVKLLSTWEPADIVAFEQPLWDLLMVSYRADLWAAAYVINCGASDDGFDYFRGWLVAQGRDTFELALADPESLAGHPAVIAAVADENGLECEDVLAVASYAYEQVTGTDELPDAGFVIEYPGLDPDWDFDFDDAAEMRRRLPRLAALYEHGEG
ncbi:DUF4240 domain-containing protein [Dactylosporangium siamense]|uniref:DUF4240 domain-containing protein n=1 Tax=Dactylosporangium siamense TaxID=685454 RepID=A0A919PWN5_9ACTN|nr:DUF4240 domain-containing protein [Dactylosporangium siamense]GIG49848.1 hypothetical protein Dsi01nite_078890 [Dactylosporangium siamense]